MSCLLKKSGRVAIPSDWLNYFSSQKSMCNYFCKGLVIGAWGWFRYWIFKVSINTNHNP